jgi:hypothetical protein
MKTINVTFTDAEFKKLKKAKDQFTYGIVWSKFIMLKCTKGVSVKRRPNKTDRWD